MAQANHPESLHQRCVDLLFAQAAGGAPAEQGGPHPVGVPTVFDVAPAASALLTTAPAMMFGVAQPNWPRRPPDLSTPEGVQAAFEWFREEKARLEAYTRSQFGAIRKQQEDLLAQHVRNEQSLLAGHLRNEEALAVRTRK